MPGPTRPDGTPYLALVSGMGEPWHPDHPLFDGPTEAEAAAQAAKIVANIPLHHEGMSEQEHKLRWEQASDVQPSDIHGWIG